MISKEKEGRCAVLFFMQSVKKAVYKIRRRSTKIVGIRFFYLSKKKIHFLEVKTRSKRLLLKKYIIFSYTISCGGILDFPTRYGIIV